MWREAQLTALKLIYACEQARRCISAFATRLYLIVVDVENPTHSTIQLTIRVFARVLILII